VMLRPILLRRNILGDALLTWRRRSPKAPMPRRGCPDCVAVPCVYLDGIT
jgi:hypothetical protein